MIKIKSLKLGHQTACLHCTSVNIGQRLRAVLSKWTVSFQYRHVRSGHQLSDLPSLCFYFITYWLSSQVLQVHTSPYGKRHGGLALYFFISGAKEDGFLAGCKRCPADSLGCRKAPWVQCETIHLSWLWTWKGEKKSGKSLQIESINQCNANHTDWSTDTVILSLSHSLFWRRVGSHLLQGRGSFCQPWEISAGNMRGVCMVAHRGDPSGNTSVPVLLPYQGFHYISYV